MRYVLLILICFAWACNNKAEAPILTKDSAEPDGTELDDTLALVASDTTSSTAVTKIPEGFFKVILPCDGCRGIEHTVYFQRNKTYTIEEVRQGKETAITKTSGQFNPSGNMLWAYKGVIVKARYTWAADTLYYLLPNDKRLAMQKLPTATDNDVWRRKGKEGLAFYGVGNEPFWNLEINQQKNIAFYQAEWTKPVQFKKSTLISSGDSIIYTAVSDSATLKATFYNRFCSDGMSDFIYTHHLRIVYNGKTFTGCAIMY